MKQSRTRSNRAKQLLSDEAARPGTWGGRCHDDDKWTCSERGHGDGGSRSAPDRSAADTAGRRLSDAENRRVFSKVSAEDGERDSAEQSRRLNKCSHGSLNNTWTAQIQLLSVIPLFFSLRLCKARNIKAEEKLKPAKERKMEGVWRSRPRWRHRMDHSHKRRDLVNDSIRSYDCIFKYSHVPRVWMHFIEVWLQKTARERRAAWARIHGSFEAKKKKQLFIIS